MGQVACPCSFGHFAHRRLDDRQRSYPIIRSFLQVLSDDYLCRTCVQTQCFVNSVSFSTSSMSCLFAMACSTSMESQPAYLKVLHDESPTNKPCLVIYAHHRRRDAPDIDLCRGEPAPAPYNILYSEMLKLSTGYWKQVR